MQRIRNSGSHKWVIALGLIGLVVVANGITRAQPLPRVQGLFDAGDYYLNRDGSAIHLWRSKQEVALRRDKTLSQDTALQEAGGKGVLLSADWFGTHKVEIYTVDDAAIASQDLAPKDEIAWAFPVLADPVSGLRILLSDEVIVQLRHDANADAVVAEFARREFKIVNEPLPSSPGMYVIRLPNPKAVDIVSATRDLINIPGIEWAQPNFIRELQFYFVPNDHFFSRQQGLNNTNQNGAVFDADVDAPEAWDAKQGNANLVVAIVDCGVDTTHPDLNIFTNPNEFGNGRESNGVDNDGNGYKDDYHGWDFQSGFGAGDNDPNPGTSYKAAHGTACAGLAGALQTLACATIASCPGRDGERYGRSNR